VNIFNAKDAPFVVFIVFTKDKPVEEIKRAVCALAQEEGCTCAHPEIVLFNMTNKVEKFFTEIANVNLETLYEELDRKKANEDLFVIKKKTKKHPDDAEESPDLYMDQKRFSALILQPFPSRFKIKLEVYSSGAINVTGVKTEEQQAFIERYINDTLIPLFHKHADGEEDCNLDFDFGVP
jgi:hypothetical protein